MSAVAIRVHRLGKQYRLGQRRAHDTVREGVTGAARSRFASLRGSPRPAREGRLKNEGTLWALRDVSFSVESGEVVGLIGRNGAGKSTLLKVLSRITRQTVGDVELRGRVRSLLEIGTGFHPDLSGHENIYLNGAILGMRKKEIDSKYDEIVAFADVERFLDTPIKRYSSGMQVRLAFSVAAHLEPEILLVDEVLAVGDASFQRKCLAKMEHVGQHGRTVVFVSHNTTAITRLCPRALLLDGGRVIEDGPSHKVVGAYLRPELGSSAVREWIDAPRAPGDDVVRLRAVRVRSEDGEITDAIDIRRSATIEIEYDVLRRDVAVVPGVDFFNEEGIYLFCTCDFHDPMWSGRKRPAGRYRSSVRIPGNFLAEGTVVLNIGFMSTNPDVLHFKEPDTVSFHVIDSLDGDAARGDYAGFFGGVVRPLFPWTTELT